MRKVVKTILLIGIPLLLAISCERITGFVQKTASDTYYDGVRRLKEERKEAYYHDWNYVYSFARAKTNETGMPVNDERRSSQMADAVMKYSIKYKLDPQIVARKIWKETWYNQWARSHVIDSAGRYVRDRNGNPIPIAWGLAQINIEANWKIFKIIGDGQYKDRVHSIKDVEFLVWNIELNVEAGCYILSNYLAEYHSYELAATAYWAGQNSTQFRDLRWKGVRNQYIDEILNPSVFEYNAALYHGWKFIKQKDWRAEPDPFDTVQNQVAVVINTPSRKN